MTGTCLIISGSPECYIPMKLAEAGLIIACDSGYVHAMRAGIMPHVVVGDFDSYSGKVAPGIQVIRSIPEKDDTDTMMALKIAIKNGFKKIIIAGALGGRIDHGIANISATAYAAERGARCYLIDKHHQIFAIKDSKVAIKKGKWQAVSIFAIDDKALGVSLEGLKYPLADAELTNKFPLGVSNEFASEKAEISVKNGTLLIVLTDLQ